MSENALRDENRVPSLLIEDDENPGSPKRLGNSDLLGPSQIAGETETENFLDAHGDFEYTRITADTLIRTGTGLIAGMIVASHTSGTIKLWDNTSAAGEVLLNTYTFAAGSQIITFPQPIRFGAGLYADIGGTVDITLIWKGPEYA